MNEPRADILILRQPAVFRPGERLQCEYSVSTPADLPARAVEESVLWYTEGKGDEDFSVHYFERRIPDPNSQSEKRRFETRLPNSPLSYAGRIVRIRWCVRVRLYLGKSREVYFDEPFVLTSKLAQHTGRDYQGIDVKSAFKQPGPEGVPGTTATGPDGVGPQDPAGGETPKRNSY